LIRPHHFQFAENIFVWPLVEAGKIRPVVHATFPLEEARKAHELMETSTHTGKIR
jgi:NADPH2:quinone reductase